MEEVAAMSAADQAAMDRRMKLELWKAQKEAEKAVKGQVRSSRARPRAALSAAGLVHPSHPIAACGVECAHAYWHQRLALGITAEDLWHAHH